MALGRAVRHVPVLGYPGVVNAAVVVAFVVGLFVGMAIVVVAITVGLWLDE